MKAKKLLMIVFVAAIGACQAKPRTFAAELFYGFDDGSFQGWEYIKQDGTPFPLGLAHNGWSPWADPIDIGDGFTLVTATSGDFRIVPFPWETRDCLGGNQCETQILRSPPFVLDDSGDISIDMIGGQLRGGTTDIVEGDVPFEVADLPEFRTNEAGVGASQAFALRDVISDEYVLFGFSDVENDGKMRDSDPPSRGQWQTVTIPQAELAPFANGQTYTVDIYDSYLGGWGWIGFDSVRIPGTLEGEGLDCDFDASGVCDLVDLDELLYTGLGTNNSKYDLDASGGEITLADRDAFLTRIDSFPGDFDLDGQVVAGDLNILGGNWQITGLTSYGDGDANGDGIADARDLNDLGGNWQQGAAAASAVPEPSAMFLFFSALVFLGLRRH